jgi:hypothetical protein
MAGGFVLYSYRRHIDPQTCHRARSQCERAAGVQT